MRDLYIQTMKRVIVQSPIHAYPEAERRRHLCIKVEMNMRFKSTRFNNLTNV